MALAIANVSGVTLRKDDLPADDIEAIDKIDPLSRYVNDENIAQKGSKKQVK